MQEKTQLQMINKCKGKLCRYCPNFHKDGCWLSKVQFYPREIPFIKKVDENESKKDWIKSWKELDELAKISSIFINSKVESNRHIGYDMVYDYFHTHKYDFMDWNYFVEKVNYRIFGWQFWGFEKDRKYKSHYDQNPCTKRDGSLRKKYTYKAKRKVEMV